MLNCVVTTCWVMTTLPWIWFYLVSSVFSLVTAAVLLMREVQQVVGFRVRMARCSYSTGACLSLHSVSELRIKWKRALLKPVWCKVCFPSLVLDCTGLSHTYKTKTDTPTRNLLVLSREANNLSTSAILLGIDLLKCCERDDFCHHYVATCCFCS